MITTRIVRDKVKERLGLATLSKSTKKSVNVAVKSFVAVMLDGKTEDASVVSLIFCYTLNLVNPHYKYLLKKYMNNVLFQKLPTSLKCVPFCVFFFF